MEFNTVRLLFAIGEVAPCCTSERMQIQVFCSIHFENDIISDMIFISFLVSSSIRHLLSLRMFFVSKCYCSSGWSCKCLCIDRTGFVQLAIPLCHAGLWDRGFHVLQYCHRVVKGSLSSARSCLLLLTRGIHRVMSVATNSSVIWFLLDWSMDATPENWSELTLLRDKCLQYCHCHCVCFLFIFWSYFFQRRCFYVKAREMYILIRTDQLQENYSLPCIFF